MKKLSEKEIKKVELDILLYLHKICEKNHLKYSLAGGTLIGAIRHKGFIPWDDDVDIFMPLDDYQKLIDILSKNPKNFKYQVYDLDHSDDYDLPFAKLCDQRTVGVEENVNRKKEIGLYVDIFPIVNVPVGIKEFFYWKKISLYKNLYARCVLEKKLLTDWKDYIIMLISLYYKIINTNSRSFSIKIRNFALNCSKKNYGYIANSMWGYGEKEKLKSDIFEGLIDVEFEKHKFRAFANYDVYLTQIYGNYMKLPSMEKRINHNISAYWKF